MTEQRNSDDIDAKIEEAIAPLVEQIEVLTGYRSVLQEQITIQHQQINEVLKKNRILEQLLHNMAMRKLAEGQYLVQSATSLQRDIDFALDDEEVA